MSDSDIPKDDAYYLHQINRDQELIIGLESEKELVDRIIAEAGVKPRLTEADWGLLNWAINKRARMQQQQGSPPPVFHPPKPNPTSLQPTTQENTPPSEDSPLAQGAPDVETSSVVIEVIAGPVPPQLPPEEANPNVWGPLAYLPPEEVVIRIVPEPVSDEELQSTLQKLRRNEPEPGEPDFSFSDPRARKPAEEGDPVDLFTGAFTIDVVDLVVPTAYIRISMSRSYRSGRPYFGPFGYGWDHTFNVYLRPLNDGRFALWTGQLREVYFRRKGAGWEPEAGFAGRLEKTLGVSEVFSVHLPGGMQWLFERPAGWSDVQRIPLVSIRDRHGNSVNLTYGPLDRVVSVLDTAGRGLFFYYGSCELLEKVTDHTRTRIVLYEHDKEIEHLVRVIFPATGQYPKGFSTTYEYDRFAYHHAMQHNILRIFDAEKRLMVENEYAGPESGWEFNTVVRQRLAGFEYQFEYQQIQYVWPDPTYADVLATRTLVRPPDGSLHTYTFNYRGDLLDHRFRLHRDSSFRVIATQYKYDVEGNLTEIIAPDGLRQIFTYDSANADPCARRNLKRVELGAPHSNTVPSRVVYQAQYEPRYQLVTKTKDELGAETHIFYDFDVNPVGATGRLSRIQLPKVVGTDGVPQQSNFLFEHNVHGQITAIVKPEGGRTELTYISGGIYDGFLSTITEDPATARLITKFEYDAAGFLKQSEAPGGRITGFKYNALGQIEESVAPIIAGQHSKVKKWYDDSGQIARIERPAGSYSAIIQGASILDEYERDELGNLVSMTLAANTDIKRKWIQCVDHEGRPVSTWDPSGMRTNRVFGENGVLLSETTAVGDAEAQTIKYLYDEAGRIEHIIGHLKDKTSFKYDIWGRLQRITLPNRAVKTFKFGKRDLLLEERTEETVAGEVTLLQQLTYEYDKRGRLSSKTLWSSRDNGVNAVPLKMHYVYDKDDNLRALILPRGASYRYDFDKVGRITQTTDPHGNVRQFIYDASGDLNELNMIEVENGAVRTTTRRNTYDARGRLKRSDYLGTVEQYEYDDRDLPIEQRTPSGVTTRLQYDAFGQVIERLIDPGGLALRSQFEYDLNGRLRLYIDPTGQITKWRYDVHGRTVEIKPPDGTTWEYHTDTSAHTIEQQMPSGNKVVLEYAEDERLTIKMTTVAGAGQEPTALHEFVYDGLGRLVRASNDADSIIRRYDSLGRLIEETARGKTVRMEYDDNTGSADLVFPDGRRERTEHNPMGQPTRITLVTPGALGGTAGEVLLEIGYSPAGRPVQMTYGNGVEGLMVYDDQGRLIRSEYQKDGVILDSCRLRYDANGHCAVVQYLGAPTRNVVHRFDGNERLIEARWGFPQTPLVDAETLAAQADDVAAAWVAAAGAPGVEYSLDDADTRTNITGLNGGAANENYVSGNDHRVLSVGASAITYNADGTRTGDSRHVYELDALNRVKRVRNRATNAIVAELQYDALSRVAAGTTDGQAFERWFAGSTRIHEISGIAANTTSQYSSHPLWPLSFCVVNAAETAYIHHDEGLSTMCVTDADGAVLERHRYGVFGASSILAGDGVTPLASLRAEPIWRGMLALGTTKLFQTPQRLYDPKTGVFMSRDPLLYADSPSPYAYAAHNPVDFADPTGLAKSPLGHLRSSPKFDNSWERSHQEARAWTTDEMNRAQDERIFNLDLPPSELPYDWPEFSIPYSLLYGLKQGIYKPIKAHLLDERPKYLDSNSNVRTTSFRPDRSPELASAYGNIAIMPLTNMGIMTGGTAKSPSILLSGKRLPIVNPNFQTTIQPQQAMQRMQNAIINRFAANPRLVGNYLSTREINVLLDAQAYARFGEWSALEQQAPTIFGKAVERAMCRVLSNSRLGIPTGQLRGPGGRFISSTDFRGINAYNGLFFESTTNAQLFAHTLRGYPQSTVYLTYDIPVTWYFFLIP